MYSRDLQIKYLQFRSRVELTPDEDGMNRHDFDSHANIRFSLVADCQLESCSNRESSQIKSEPIHLKG
ncbi:UNVERIFIED_ORG: hypothetical protein J2806_004039 [Kosakonia oryzae]|uniref:Uncharacterized protein n=1 Tax=Kosakonia radicincitans TaxID=283686 RepID=A0AAX2EYF1_9ENTR|nr:hypothetical protein [Kosakonia oryzae]SFF25601.1 hypothetical protein SAMN03159468_04349 [Kosakonia radicincitans]SFR25082.1 hypothetical protein SAMN03159514_04539 [Kosakonia radicincitans]SFU06357.1 hypothetical protein SAMN03159428_03812 [Kosakonia radicincitans]SFY06525.1 hypothetical protein SAMN03159436_03641 [Kosakonia radicincitans]